MTEFENQNADMAKQRIIPGAILEINICGMYYCYAQIMNNKESYAFFDLKSKIRQPKTKRNIKGVQQNKKVYP